MTIKINYKSYTNLPVEDALTALQAAIEILSCRDDAMIINMSDALESGQPADVYLGGFQISINPL